MRAITRYSVMAVAIPLVAFYALGQEVVPTPAPADAAKITPHVSANASGQTSATPAAKSTTDRNANRWRYRWSNGRWWYWTPQNRWMWYNGEESRWIAYAANPTPPVAAPTENPATYDDSYAPNYGYYGYRGYYPSYGYGYGYYPDVAVGVRPYGNVDVGVGRRVGVGVWGPHGAVRVGRIYVGW